MQVNITQWLQPEISPGNIILVAGSGFDITGADRRKLSLQCLESFRVICHSLVHFYVSVHDVPGPHFQRAQLVVTETHVHQHVKMKMRIGWRIDHRRYNACSTIATEEDRFADNGTPIEGILA